MIANARRIIVPPAADGLDDYAKLFAEQVSVFEGNKKVAGNRAAFLAYLRLRTDLKVQPLHIAYGNPILVAETVSNFGRRAGPDVVVIDCCFWARTASYHLDSRGKVDRVIFLETDSFWGPPEKTE